MRGAKGREKGAQSCELVDAGAGWWVKEKDVFCVGLEVGVGSLYNFCVHKRATCSGQLLQTPTAYFQGSRTSDSYDLRTDAEQLNMEVKSGTIPPVSPVPAKRLLLSSSHARDFST